MGKNKIMKNTNKISLIITAVVGMLLLLSCALLLIGGTEGDNGVLSTIFQEKILTPEKMPIEPVELPVVIPEYTEEELLATDISLAEFEVLYEKNEPNLIRLSN